MEQETGKGEEMEGRQGGGQPTVVAGQAAKAAQAKLRSTTQRRGSKT